MAPILTLEDKADIVRRVFAIGEACKTCRYAGTYLEGSGPWYSPTHSPAMAGCALLEGEVADATPEMCPGYEEPNGEEEADARGGAAQGAARAAGEG